MAATPIPNTTVLPETRHSNGVYYLILRRGSARRGIGMGAHSISKISILREAFPETYSGPILINSGFAETIQRSGSALDYRRGLIQPILVRGRAHDFNFDDSSFPW